MRIVSWGARKRTGDELVQKLSDAAQDSLNWTTVLIGRNGTKKSLLLRLLLEGALGHALFRQGSHATIRPLVNQLNAERIAGPVIALAGTPFDRFPRQTKYQRPTIPTKFDVSERYVYLGMKAANGTMGAAHTVRTLTFLLLDCLGDEGAPASPAKKVLDFLDLQPEVKVIFRRHTSLNVSKRESKEYGMGPMGEFSELKLRSAIARLQTQVAADNAVDVDVLNLVQRLLSEKGEIEELSYQLSRLPDRLVFNFGADVVEGYCEKAPFSPAELRVLVAAGLVTSSHLEVKKYGAYEDKPLVADGDLSSGQWHLMSSMLGLAVTAKDHSLVLVDEPENSLHPDWQRSYLQLMSEVLAHREGCHTVVATHSPFIASGVENDSGNVLRLTKDDAGPLGIATQLVDVTYGWDAGDVYQEVFGMRSTRAASFVDKANTALALIREGRDEDEHFKELAAELAKTSERLPKGDSMRTIVNAIARIADDGEGRQ